MQRKIVEKIEEGVDRKDVLCTTYQMRNFFRQLSDGCADELDVFSYMQHAYAADLCKEGQRVLDVCCGRGLLLPFLRYRGNIPSLYCGVDICRKNAIWANGDDPRRGFKTKKDWGFELRFIEANVSEMSRSFDIKDVGSFDLVVYTSAIEHMHHDEQKKSLIECHKLSKESAILYLTCPITEHEKSGYDCQYAAHVYEPKISELTEWLSDAGWHIGRKVGLVTKPSRINDLLSDKQKKAVDSLKKAMPREQLLPTVACLFPECATEMAFICWKR